MDTETRHCQCSWCEPVGITADGEVGLTGYWRRPDGFYVSPLRKPLTDDEVRDAWRGAPR